jgi:hypothetical protein
VGQLKQGGKVTTTEIGEHDDRVHKVALEPGSRDIIYSCGEDGLVQHVSHCSVICNYNNNSRLLSTFGSNTFVSYSLTCAAIHQQSSSPAIPSQIEGVA